MLPRGRQLVTLQDAGTYITKLPMAEPAAEEWQAAIEALMLVARGGPTNATGLPPSGLWVIVRTGLAHGRAALTARHDENEPRGTG